MLSGEYVKEVRRIEHEEAKFDNTSLAALKPSQEHVIAIPNSSFLATTRRIMHFSNNREPKATDKVVYI